MNLPAKVEITEVCPRDGFQNISSRIPTAEKIEIILDLMRSGVKSIEVASFVSPKWIPQMADSGEVVRAVAPYAKAHGIRVIALAPNRRGFDDAVEAGADTVSFVISVSEAHNRSNVNKTPEESLSQFTKIARNKGRGVKLRLALATSFGCPFGTEITPEMVDSMVRRGVEAGADEILLADTIGSANPVQVRELLTKTIPTAGGLPLGLHMHDTRGLALTNIYQALLCGVTMFESAAGGLGGCPYAPGASGNVATEDLLNMLASIKVETGVDTDKIMQAVDLIKRCVDVPLVSHMASLRYNKCSGKAATV